MKMHFKVFGLLLVTLVIAWVIAGCGTSGSLDPNVDFKAALQEIDLSDGGEGGATVESSALSPITSQSLNTMNGIVWQSCHFDQVTTSKQLVTVTNNSTTAIGNVNFTVTGYYHVKIKNTATDTITELNDPFSVSGTGTVNFSKNTNGRWYVESFTIDPLMSDPALSPTISNVSFATVPPFEISLSNQSPPFVSSADISCAAMPSGTEPLLLFIATRNFGIDWSTLGRRQFVDPSNYSSPYQYTCTLPLRPEIRAKVAGAPHFGGIYACELVNTGTDTNPDYAVYLTIYPGMIKVTP